MVGDIDGYWQILTDITGATSVTDLPPHLAHLEWLVLSWCVFALLEGVCRSFQTSFLWKRWSPFVVSSRACLWKVQSLLPQNQLPCWGEPGLLFKSVHLLRASSAQAALVAMVHAKTGSLYTCALRSVCLHCLSLWPFNCGLLWDVVCTDWLACHDLEDLLWGYLDSETSGWWFGTWISFFHIFGNYDPNWLSYFSEGWLNHKPGHSSHVWVTAPFSDVS